MKACWLAVAWLTAAVPAAAQEAVLAPSADQSPGSTGSAWSEFWSGLQVRQNTNVRKDVARPAFVTLTVPAEGPSTYQIGLGVLAPVLSRTLVDVDALIDYQRNSAVDDAQNVFRAGATGEWQWLAMSAAGHHHSPLLSFRGDFKNDAVKGERGWQAAAGYTHLFQGQRSFPHPNLPFRFGTALEVVYFPFVAIELDDTVSSDDKTAERLVTRALGQISLALLPAPATLREKLEFLVGYAYRRDLQDSVEGGDRSHPLFTFEANFYPFQADRGEAGFGVSYTDGEDPDEGLTRQQYWEFSFKIRLK